MALIDISLRGSNAIGRMSQFKAIVPEGKKGPFPVLYLLHGLSDDHTAWTARTSLERYVESMPLIVVMPNGHRSWYTNAAGKPNENFETYIVSELVSFVDATFPTIPTAQGRALAGLSMGGYGAVKLAVKNPDLFCAAHSFSGALDMASRQGGAEDAWSRELNLIFGNHLTDGTEDIFAIVKNTPKPALPAISFDCGIDDFLIEHNRKLHAHLDKLDIAHIYQEYPGDHNWQYWDLHIQDALPWIAKQLGIADPPAEPAVEE